MMLRRKTRKVGVLDTMVSLHDPFDPKYIILFVLSPQLGFCCEAMFNPPH